MTDYSAASLPYADRAAIIYESVERRSQVRYNCSRQLSGISYAITLCVYGTNVLDERAQRHELPRREEIGPRPNARLAPFPPIGTGSFGTPNGISAKTRSTSPFAASTAAISSGPGRRYSFPFAPSTITAVITIPRRPACPSRRRSSIVMITLQSGHVAPARDIVPRPSLRSCSLRWAALPLPCGTSYSIPKTSPRRSLVGFIVRRTRFLSFLQSQRVFKSGSVARQPLQLTVRAHR